MESCTTKGVGLGYFASILCDFVRRGWIKKNISFTFETVMSNRDKLALLTEARAASYRTYLYYICTEDPSVNQRRVEGRVKDGGHTVPSDKIRARYHRSLGLLAEAISLCDRAYLFDNTGTGHELIAEFEQQQLIRMSDDPPHWFMDHVLNKRK